MKNGPSIITFKLEESSFSNLNFVFYFDTQIKAMKIYYLHSWQQFLGPFTLDEIRQQAISREDLIWKDGTPDWVPAGTLEEFACIFKPEEAYFKMND